MAKKFSEFTQLTAPANSDLILVDDVSAAATKYMTLSDLMKITTAIPNNTIAAAMLATNAITLGYAQITANFSTAATSATLVTGLSLSVTIPAGGRRVFILCYAPDGANTGNALNNLTIWDGTVGSGTQLQSSAIKNRATGDTTGFMFCIASVTPAAGAKTYGVGFHTNTGTATLSAAATAPAFVLVGVI